MYGVVSHTYTVADMSTSKCVHMMATLLLMRKHSVCWQARSFLPVVILLTNFSNWFEKLFTAALSDKNMTCFNVLAMHEQAHSQFLLAFS